MDYKKSDSILRLQLLRMQLEVLTFCQINLEKHDESLIGQMEQFWLQQCKLSKVKPENNFISEFESFRTETLLKFAPNQTLFNMQKKAQMAIKKLGFDNPTE